MKELRKAPCYHCKDRQEGCHSQCERYIKYRGELDKESRARAEENAAKGILYDRLTKQEKAGGWNWRRDEK